MSPTGARPSERAAKRSMCERFCGDRAGWWAVSLPRSLTKIVSGWSGLSSGWNLRRGVPWANADSTSPATALLPRGSDHLRLEDPDKGQIAIQLPVVQPVAHDEFVWDLKPAILNRQRVHDAPRGFVEQRADVQAGRIAGSQRAQQIIGGQAGGGFGQAILEEQTAVIATVEDLHADIGVQLAEPAEFAVLLGHEALLECGEFDVQIDLRKIEVRVEALHDPTLVVPLQWKAPRIVLPPDTVKVQEPGELSFTFVREAGACRRSVALVFAVSHRVGSSLLVPRRGGRATPRPVVGWRSAHRRPDICVQYTHVP